MKKKITKRAIVVITVLLIGAMALLSGCQAASAANGAGEAAAKSTQTEVLEAGASVSDAAVGSGYLDAKALTRAFKKYEGITTGSYRDSKK